MQYREMPGTGEKVSILGFGAMRLPLEDPKDQKSIDEDLSVRMIRRSIDGGVNYVDTAWVYHGEKSEPLVGRALRDGYREKVFLATKLPTWQVESRADMDRFLDTQLERLETGTIDFYLIHSLKRDWWEKMKSLGMDDFLEEARMKGKIKHAGFSFHGDRKTFTDIVDGHPWSFCQIMYNYLDEDFQAGREGLMHAAAKGVGVVVMEPLRGGKLASNLPVPVSNIFAKARVERTPVEWALRWIWNHPQVSVVLSGMSAMEHVEENLRVAEGGSANTLSAEELALIDEAKAAFKESVPVPCTMCGYCVPCPAGVNIPGCFGIFNNAHMFNTLEASKKMYPMVVADTERASNCIDCGECEEKCPQEIPVREKLKDVVKVFES